MKRINIILSDELAESVETLAERKEMSVSEIVRRGVEMYVERFPEKAVTPSKLPSFHLGKTLKKDFKEAIYRKRAKEIAG